MTTKYYLDEAEAAIIDFSRRRYNTAGPKPEQRAEIIRLRASGCTWTAIGRLFGISPQACQISATRKRSTVS